MKTKTCGLCEHLSFTEQEQQKFKVKAPHFCKKYNKRVYHMDLHPLIISLDECDVNNEILEG